VRVVHTLCTEVSMHSMHSLQPGSRHSIQANNNPTQTIVCVKLTDSALRTFEDYLKNRAVLEKSGVGAPTIQFSNSGGAISLPVGGERGHVNYSFGLSNEDGGSNKQGTTACLRATHNSFETVGTIDQTLRVKASDDVYQRIGQKFQDVKMEQAKNTTVLLENKDKKKASVPKPNIVRKAVPSMPIPAPARERVERERSYGNVGMGITAQPPRTAHSPSVVRQPPQPSSGYSKPPHKPEHNQPERKLEKFPQAHKPKPAPTTNPEIMKRSLRERLLHLLAVRTYKKPELIARINRDGIKEKDKKSITPTLREVSDCKNNVHELKRSMWNDIHEDWPFYTESDKVALKRRKPQNLTPPGSDTGSTSSGHSPSSTNPASPPQITNPLKRQGGGFFPGDRDAVHRERERDLSADVQQPSPKKKRVSSYKRPGGDWSKSPGLSVSPGQGLSLAFHDRDGGSLGDPVGRHSVSPRLDYESCALQHDDSLPDWNKFTSEKETPVPAPPPVVTKPVQKSKRSKSPKSPKKHRDRDKNRQRSSNPVQPAPVLVKEEPTLAESTEVAVQEQVHQEEQQVAVQEVVAAESLDQENNTPQRQQPVQNQNKDFLEIYTPITGLAERNRYKQEFNSYYNRYRKLHDVLDAVSNRFSQLEERMRNTPRATPQFQEVKAQIRAEYQRSCEDSVYQEARASFQYLHEKLAHIKKLVHDFDTANPR